MRSPKSILITGASSGIGAALAREYAGPETVLFLTGRNEERLAAVAADCIGAGAKTHTKLLDVTDRQAMAAWIDAVDAMTPLDLVIANAGISAGAAESDALLRRVFSVNFDGVANTVQPALVHMKARSSGQIAIMSSLASFVGFAGAPAYCASKAALRVWGESLRATYERLPKGGGRVEVSVICPGFVRTPLIKSNKFTMPGMMEPDRAARIIRRGLAAGRGRIAFPWFAYFAVWLLVAVPDRWIGKLVGKLPLKGSTAPGDQAS